MRACVCVCVGVCGGCDLVGVLLQVTSDQQFEVVLKRQLEEKRAQVLELESSMANLRGELATLKGQLAASEDVSHLCVVLLAVWSCVADVASGETASPATYGRV